MPKKKYIFPLLLVALTIINMLVGCTQHTVQTYMHKEANPKILRQEQAAQPEALGTLSTGLGHPMLTQKPALAVLLLHGLGAPANELEPIAQKTSATFGDAVLIMQPTCREGTSSLTRSIDNQAKKIVKYIESELKQHNKDPKSFPLIIIGYSHGGVLACHLGSSYKNKLNIRGIITITAPLMGTPVLNCNPCDIQEFMSNAQDGLQLISYRPLSNIKWNMGLYALALTIIRPSWMPIPCANGLKDILPDSTCIKNICNFLRDASHNIPCLLIAGHQNDFRELFFQRLSDKQSTEHHKAIERLNDAYAQLVTGNKEGLHDTLIPLRSQLCRGSSLDELTMITDTHDPIIMPMPNQPSIEKHIYKNITHAGNLIVIDDDLFVETEQCVVTSDQIYNSVAQFIKKRLEGLE